MIFRRSIVAELTSAASAVFTVLFSILFSVGLVRILGQAAGGRVDNQAVFQLLALTSLTWLPVVLTLTLFIAVLMTLSRAYRDSEMVVWFTSGQSLLAWLGPVLRFAWPIVVAVALLSMFVTPWSMSQIEELRRSFMQRDDVSRVAPGRFIESGGGADRVFFVESVDFEGGQVRNVFVSMRSQGRDGVIVASKGEIEVAPNGDRFLVLEQGRRYEGRPGSAEYRTMEFDRYSIRIESRPDRPLGERSVRTKRMSRPAGRADTRLRRPSCLWRIGIPIAALVVTLLAIPLAYTNPRVGRSFNLIIAVLAFAVYLNVLNTVQAWVQQERVSFSIGVWVVHAVVLLVIVVLFVRRVYLQRWWPPRLTPAYWRGRRRIMKTLRRYLWKEIATATGFMLFALLSLFTFFDLVAQLDEIGQRGFKLRHALAYVALTLPSRTYEMMPIAALIGTIYALSKLAANSEFTIMRVSGMSTRRLLVSLLGIGLADGGRHVPAGRGRVAAGRAAGAADAAQGARRADYRARLPLGRLGARRRQGARRLDRRLSLHQRATGVAGCRDHGLARSWSSTATIDCARSSPPTSATSFRASAGNPDRRRRDPGAPDCRRRTRSPRPAPRSSACRS